MSPRTLTGNTAKFKMKLMKCKMIGFEENGPPSVLNIYEAEFPTTTENVVVETDFVGVNMGDVIRRARGNVPALPGEPYIPGFEGVGRVVRTPKNQKHLFGKQVAFLYPHGAYATHVEVPVENVFEVPKGVEAAVLAGVICSGLTAWMIVEKTKPTATDSVLVHGAAGGVGHLLIQLVKQTGAHVIATVSSDDKAKFAVRCGADKTLVVSEQSDGGKNFGESEKVDIVLDGVGKASLGLTLAAIRAHGRWVVFGSASGVAMIPSVEILTKRLSVSGVLVFDILSDEMAWKNGMTALCNSLQSGALKPTVQIRPYTDFRRIHEDLEQRKILGRVVMEMSGLGKAEATPIEYRQWKRLK